MSKEMSYALVSWYCFSDYVESLKLIPYFVFLFLVTENCESAVAERMVNIVLCVMISVMFQFIIPLLHLAVSVTYMFS